MDSGLRTEPVHGGLTVAQLRGLVGVLASR
jgi:hypothetical protein